MCFMRYSLLMVPLVAVGLAACSGGSSSTQSTTDFTTREHASRYMTPEESNKLIILPGDATTAVQLRELSAANEGR
jgi:hypothetical protein